MTKALPGHADSERQNHLVCYLQAWLKSHALTIKDLMFPEVRRRLLATLSTDLGGILNREADFIAGYLGAALIRGGANLLQKGVKRLFGS